MVCRSPKMNDVVKVAIIVSIAPTLMALVAILTTVLTSRKADGKLDQIHTLTNSTLTAANKRIDELEALVKRLLVERAGNTIA